MSAKTPPNQNPKSKFQNPNSKIRNPKSKIYAKIQNPKSEIQNPKSKIQNPKSKIQNPKSEIQNPRENPKFGAVGASRKGMLHNDPKSKIPEIRPKKFGFWPKKFGFWVLDWGILDFGFWIPDFGFWGGPGDVPLCNSVAKRLGKGSELGCRNRSKRK